MWLQKHTKVAYQTQNNDTNHRTIHLAIRKTFSLCFRLKSLRHFDLSNVVLEYFANLLFLSFLFANFTAPSITSTAFTASESLHHLLMISLEIPKAYQIETLRQQHKQRLLMNLQIEKPRLKQNHLTSRSAAESRGRFERRLRNIFGDFTLPDVGECCLLFRPLKFAHKAKILHRISPRIVGASRNSRRNFDCN